jgi:hypothetical protein
LSAIGTGFSFVYQNDIVPTALKNLGWIIGY